MIDLHVDNNNDPDVIDDLAKRILDNQSKINDYNKLVKKETLLLKLNEDELLVQMNEQSMKSYETHELAVKIRLGTYVEVHDESAVPGDFLVSKGFRVDKSKIHQEGKAPAGTSFRCRQNLRVFRNEDEDTNILTSDCFEK